MSLTNPVGPYPPGAPTINGTNVTVDMFLRNPLQVERTVRDLSFQRFLADRIFSPGGAATGGAVIYDQVLGTDTYLAGDVQAITPGSEFPLLEDFGPTSLPAKTVKWGAAVEITYEERDRDRRDVLNRKLTKLRNGIIKKVDTVAVATLKAAPIGSATASGDWAVATTPIQKDVSSAQSAVDELDMGYVLDTAIISPSKMNDMVNNDKLADSIWKAGGQIVDPITQRPGDPRLRGFLGLDWFVSNRIDDTEVILLQSRVAGSISDEKPLYTRTVDQPLSERVVIMGARLTVPYVTDPLSVIRITGVDG